MAPRHDIAHLGRVQLYTPDAAASAAFFTDFLGLREVGGEDGSVYLRAWDEYEHHTITLTERAKPGVARTNFRAASPEALDRLVSSIKDSGRGIDWTDGETGYGPTYLFNDPDGHEMGLYYESAWFTPGEDTRPSLKNQAEAYPGKGVGVRRLDHVNYLGKSPEANRDFVRDVLGGMVTEQIVLNSGEIAGTWSTFTNKGYDVVYTKDALGLTGRLHHIAFAADTRADILRACDIALEQGVHIETGPHKHAIQQTFFLYVYEPGGNRVELCNAGARLVLAPDWKTIDWTETERKKGQAWGLKTIESFHTYGTPMPDPDAP